MVGMVERVAQAVKAVAKTDSKKAVKKRKKFFPQAKRRFLKTG